MPVPDQADILELPLIVAGHIVTEERPVHCFDYESGTRVIVPVINETDLRNIEEERRGLVQALSRLSTDDVTQFLAKAGECWLGRTTRGRKTADAYAARITGFPFTMLAADYETIGHFMVQRFHTWDQIAAEFGSERIFDEWTPTQMSWVRAFPRGLVVHYLVGNLPLAGLYTVLRSVISRNCTLAKIPMRDPVTVSSFVQSLVEVDADHPIARSLSVAYWPHDSKLGRRCLSAADAVTVWGREEATTHVKRSVRAGVPVAEYGPRWSAAIIDLTRCSADEAALRVVEDAGFYDQEACFSTQRAFVCGGDAANDAFLAATAHYFDLFSARHPASTANRDTLANRAAALLEARFLGLKVHEGNEWAVVTVDEGQPADFPHPLARTLVIHRLESLPDATRHLNSDLQTVGVFPFEVTERYRDEWAHAGADRIVPLGWSRLPRAGWTHDGTYGLHPLVRLVSLERPRNDFGKYYPPPADPTRWEHAYFRGEKWWRDPASVRAGGAELAEGEPT